MQIIVAQDASLADQVAADEDRLLTPAAVSKIFAVDVKTVTRWAKEGKIGSIRTLGGHRRYSEAEVRQLLARG